MIIGAGRMAVVYRCVVVTGNIGGLENIMRPIRRQRLGIVWSLIGASLLAATAFANGDAPEKANGLAEPDPHALHPMGMNGNVRRSEAQYTTPDVKLVRDDGKTVSLPAELDDGRPVVMNFIYT